jgi:hypothetical protein
VASLRPKEVKPLVRFEGLPGEFSQHDFGQVDVQFIDGTARRIRFFASRLKYSRWVRVSLVKDESVEISAWPPAATDHGVPVVVALRLTAHCPRAPARSEASMKPCRWFTESATRGRMRRAFPYFWVATPPSKSTVSLFASLFLIA